MGAQKAYAAESVYLSVGSSIPYGGYSTTWFSADGEMAYCGNPSAKSPPAGTYTKSGISSFSGRDQETIADLWFAYGSPGFESGLWPSTWYDGSAMTDARYAALAHILVSDTFSSNGNYALYGCNASFKNWCKRWVIGFDDNGEHPDATGRRICARQWEVPDNFQAFMLYTGSGNQFILSFKFIPYGAIDLVKVTANEEICRSNSMYSLQGAIYTVYRNSGLTDVAGYITTDKNGYGKLADLRSGTYWVKETKASPGHAKDPRSYKVTVTPGNTTRVNGSTVSEIPQSDPIGMLVGKVDGATGNAAAQGDSTLAGALFTVRYYAGDYSSAAAAEASGPPKRTWVFQTNEDGFAYLSEEYKYSGDPLYRQLNGDVTVPLGTILIQETKAPLGYNLDDGNGGTPRIFCIRITTDGAQNETVHTYNTPHIPDTVKRGDFRLVKEVPISVYSDGAGDMPQDTKRILAPGVKYELYNDSVGSVVSPESGKLVAPGNKVCTITVDENGLATTKSTNAYVNGWSKPNNWNGALCYGTYRVHEVIPPNVALDFYAKWGKTLLAVPDWKVTIRAEGQYDPPVLVTDKIPQTPLKIVKVDAETGKQIPLPVRFQLKDSLGNLVTWTSRYPETTVIDTWSSNERGEVTLPMLLEEGDYSIVEIDAPFGYVKETQEIPFHVEAEYRGWDNPTVFEFKNMPQKAQIVVEKTNSWTNQPVDSSIYLVRAADTIRTPDGTIRAYQGDIVATLTTDMEGRATSPKLYLGTYTVSEAEAKNGYALNVEQRTVTLEYAGQDVAMFTHDEAVQNTPTHLRISKTDALVEGKPVAGATFRIWNEEETFDEGFITGEDGIISFPYIEHGNYHVQEISPPKDYVNIDLDENGDPKVTDFKVNDKGMIEWDNTGEMAQSWTFEFTNIPKSIKSFALNVDSGTHECVASENFKISDSVEYTGLIPGLDYVLIGTIYNKETGDPILNASGEPITSTIEFKADESCGVIENAFEFDARELAGKSIVVFETIMHEGNEYLVHADLEDENQTIQIVKPPPLPPPPGKPYPKTGIPTKDKSALVGAMALMWACTGAGYSAYRRRKEIAELSKVELPMH